MKLFRLAVILFDRPVARPAASMESMEASLVLDFDEDAMQGVSQVDQAAQALPALAMAPPLMTHGSRVLKRAASCLMRLVPASRCLAKRLQFLVFVCFGLMWWRWCWHQLRNGDWGWRWFMITESGDMVWPGSSTQGERSPTDHIADSADCDIVRKQL